MEILVYVERLNIYIRFITSLATVARLNMKQSTSLLHAKNNLQLHFEVNKSLLRRRRKKVRHVPYSDYRVFGFVSSFMPPRDLLVVGITTRETRLRSEGIFKQDEETLLLRHRYYVLVV